LFLLWRGRLWQGLQGLSAMSNPLEERYPVAFRTYPYGKVADQALASAVRHQVVVVGGGPVGLATALDLGLKGVKVLLLDDHEGAGAGSRALCFAKRTLEIANRLGAVKPMIEKGVQWNIGKVFRDDRQLFEFNLQPESGHQFPAFINLQQPYFEKYLCEAIARAQADGAQIEIRGKNRVDALTVRDDHVVLEIMTPDGPYNIEADWLVACDGARSPLRGMMGLSFDGRVFEDNFLIADVRMNADFPTERWFWFEPHFKSGDSALLHKQPDGVWRIDFQLGWNIDRKAELQPQKIRARVDAMLGGRVEYELVWTSIYTFQCRRMARFRHGRVLFAGDSAHQLSPFGARGANSGIQDVDNLCWKLAMVLNGSAPDSLLDSYSTERVQAADENILNSTRATDFITPKSEISKIFRNAVLDLAEAVAFARPLVNSGRLSVPCIYDGSPLNGWDAPELPRRTRPGSPVADTPLGSEWLLSRLGGKFQILAIDAEVPAHLEVCGLKVETIRLSAVDNPELRARYLGEAKAAIYLLRPDQHVAARWTSFDATAMRGAVARAISLQ
jgi:3-(3-hydroxy-phenyl)propionate hydroxylase